MTSEDIQWTDEERFRYTEGRPDRLDQDGLMLGTR